MFSLCLDIHCRDCTNDIESRAMGSLLVGQRLTYAKVEVNHCQNPEDQTNRHLHIVPSLLVHCDRSENNH